MIARFLILLIVILTVPSWSEPDRSRPPRSSAPPPLHLPEITRSKLSNGMHVWVVERPGVPVVSVSLLFQAGSDLDPIGRFGLAQFTSTLLPLGAGGKSALEISDALDYLGVDLSTDCDYDGASVSLYLPVRHWKEAIDILRLVVTSPDFPESEIERVRNEALADLLRLRDDPNGLMGLIFPSLFYPPDHRYSTPTFGTEDVLRSISRSELRDFYRACYNPAQAGFIVVGDINPQEVLNSLEAHFGDWQTESQLPQPETVSNTAQESGQRIVLVDRPGAPQTVVWIGHLGVARSTSDYYPLQVLNTVLGGSFTSRLNQNLREQRGYTYGASSEFDMRKKSGLFVASADIQTDKTGAAIGEFLTELNRIREPIPQEELRKAKDYLAYSYPQDFLKVEDFAAELADLWLYELDHDSLWKYTERIREVSPEEVEKAALAHLRTEDLVVVLVGDSAAILPQLESLGLRVDKWDL